MSNAQRDQRGSGAAALPVPALVPAWWYGVRGPLAPMLTALAVAVAGGAAELAGAGPSWWATAVASHVLAVCLALAVAAVYVSGTLRDNRRPAARAPWPGAR